VAAPTTRGWQSASEYFAAPQALMTVDQHNAAVTGATVLISANYGGNTMLAYDRDDDPGMCRALHATDLGGRRCRPTRIASTTWMRPTTSQDAGLRRMQPTPSIFRQFPARRAGVNPDQFTACRARSPELRRRSSPNEIVAA
jgi:hypothetical protein